MMNLRNLLRNYFDSSGVQGLCFALSIDFEDIGPPGSKSDKIQQLIKYCYQHNRLPELIAVCQRERPHIAWPDLTVPYTEAELLGVPPLPRLAYEPEVVFVPGGPFVMGSDSAVDTYESPQHTVVLSNYYIGKYPITNQEYGQFIEQTDYKNVPPAKTGWFLGKPPQDKLDHPVVGVSWYDALAYCDWLTTKTNKPYRLPSEAEWEKAARGIEGWRYSWGDEWQDGVCQLSAQDTISVTAFDQALSPYNCANMLGNAEEWTSTIWGDSLKVPTYQYPYNPNDGREDLTANERNPRFRRIYRGGSYADEPQQVWCSRRAHARPQVISLTRGFRIVISQ